QDEDREVAEGGERDKRHLRVRERPARVRQPAADQYTRDDRHERESDARDEATVRPHPCDSCTECQQVRALLATRGRKKVGRTSVPWRLRAQLRATAIIAPLRSIGEQHAGVSLMPFTYRRSSLACDSRA